MIAEDAPPISQSITRAITQLTAIREELIEAIDCASAANRDRYQLLAPKLDDLGRFGDGSDEHVAELRALLIEATDLRDRLRRC